MKVEGDKAPYETLVREIQMHPWRGSMLHVDFLRIQAGVEVDLDVPVHIEGRGQVKDTVVPGDALRWTHTVRTTFEPRKIELDPSRTTLDWNATNDIWRPGLFGRSAYVKGLDNPLASLPR